MTDRKSPPGFRAGTPFRSVSCDTGRPVSIPPRAVAVRQPGPVVTAYDVRPERLRELRHKAGLSQRELDLRTIDLGARVSRETIARIEGGDGLVRISLETAKALANALACEPSDLA